MYIFRVLRRYRSTYLLLLNVFISFILIHPKFVVHLLAPFTDVLPLTQLIYVGQTLLGLPFRFHQNVFDFWVGLIKRKK